MVVVMNRFIRFRILHIFLAAIVMISLLLAPHPVYAWSAVVVPDEGTFFNPLNLFRSIVGFFTGKEVPQIILKDVGTHQLMMKLAYQLLEKDPAYKDQKEYFPTINGILEWEGVAAKTDRVIMEGGEWSGRKGKSGGPDAAGKSKDSYHYLNARLESGKWGNADTSVERHFNDFLLQIYSQGDFFNRGKPNDDTNHNAAWAAHYLGDTYVPHHTVGRFKEGMEAGKLSAAEAGPAYLYDFQAAVLEGKDIKRDSVVQPPEWSGLDNDFSDIFSYYRKYRAEDNKDWFDPWYYSGPYLTDKIRMGPNLVLGSHQSWESWAHSYITGNNLARVPTNYSKDWKNATPKFNSAISNIENQAAVARAFALASAKETAANMAVFMKTPDVAFNKATERVATLWRASITALRPVIRATTDAGNAKLVRVTASVDSVEPVDPAVNIGARLAVEGGKIRGNDTHYADKAVKVLPNSPWQTEWLVDTSDPAACKFKVEAIGEYKNTPDLQYAVASSGKVQAANYCRILIKTEATWNSGDKLDGTWGEQPWIYAVGGFDGTKFSGEYIHIFPNIPDRPKTTKIEVTVNKDEKGEIKSANFIFYHDTVELYGKTPRGLDDVATIKGSNVPRRPDKEAPGTMYFEVTGESVGACLDPSSSWRTAAFNKTASCCWTTKFTPNNNSFIKIELSQSPPKTK